MTIEMNSERSLFNGASFLIYEPFQSIHISSERTPFNTYRNDTSKYSSIIMIRSHFPERASALRSFSTRRNFRRRCTFRILFLGGVASRVPWGWRDSYGKTGNFGRVGDKSMFKMYKKVRVGREGDI